MGMGVAAGLTREERKKARELEEARRNGTAALEVGSDGKTVRLRCFDANLTLFRSCVERLSCCIAVVGHS